MDPVSRRRHSVDWGVEQRNSPQRCNPFAATAIVLKSPLLPQSSLIYALRTPYDRADGIGAAEKLCSGLAHWLLRTIGNGYHSTVWCGQLHIIYLNRSVGSPAASVSLCFCCLLEGGPIQSKLRPWAQPERPQVRHESNAGSRTSSTPPQFAEVIGDQIDVWSFSLGHDR
jgi:hypothetical protein